MAYIVTDYFTFVTATENDLAQLNVNEDGEIVDSRSKLYTAEVLSAAKAKTVAKKRSRAEKFKDTQAMAQLIAADTPAFSRSDRITANGVTASQMNNIGSKMPLSSSSDLNSMPLKRVPFGAARPKHFDEIIPPKADPVTSTAIGKLINTDISCTLRQYVKFKSNVFNVSCDSRLQKSAIA